LRRRRRSAQQDPKDQPVRLTMQHCGHLGVTVDEMAEAMKDDQ
jgi:hypothetical protein